MRRIVTIDEEPISEDGAKRIRQKDLPNPDSMKLYYGSECKFSSHYSNLYVLVTDCIGAGALVFVQIRVLRKKPFIAAQRK
jgi:hypothetical protein